MEKLRVSKDPSLEVISEIEPPSYSNQRTQYDNRPHRHVRPSNGVIYGKPINQIPIDGRINPGYSGNSQNSIQRDGSTPSVNGVYREQYWVCSQPLQCRNWTKRERILFFVLLGLSSVVLGLVAVVSLISRRANNNSNPEGWFPWL